MGKVPLDVIIQIDKLDYIVMQLGRTTRRSPEGKNPTPSLMHCTNFRML